MFQIYLNVPFSEKDEAKAAGAKFDWAARKWYVPNGRSPAKFERWMPENVKETWRRHYGLKTGERKVLVRALKILG